jgi:hypothetical protein
MNGKMLLKITLNEAIDPDLFAYLSQFDNTRLRAGAFRSIASAALRARSNGTAINADTGDASLVSAQSPPRQPNASVREGDTASTVDRALSPGTAMTAAMTADTPRFLVDEIGDQFANF